MTAGEEKEYARRRWEEAEQPHVDAYIPPTGDVETLKDQTFTLVVYVSECETQDTTLVYCQGPKTGTDPSVLRMNPRERREEEVQRIKSHMNPHVARFSACAGGAVIYNNRVWHSKSAEANPHLRRLTLPFFVERQEADWTTFERASEHSNSILSSFRWIGDRRT